MLPTSICSSPGLETVASFPLRITRDAELKIEVDEASNLLTTVEEMMEQRAPGKPVQDRSGYCMREGISHMLEQKLGIGASMLYPISHPVGMADLMQLISLNRPDLKDSPFCPSLPRIWPMTGISSLQSSHDILLYQPYDGFTRKYNFIRQAAHRPDVPCDRNPRYRVGSNSPIVNALIEARENGTVVAALN